MNVPPPLGLSRPSQHDRKYSLRIVQQPVRGRCFGFGEKDRRLIDPPPILQLVPEDERPISSFESMLFVVHCELLASDLSGDRNVVFVPNTLVPPVQTDQEGVNVMSLRQPASVRNLIGSLSSSAYHLNNEHGQSGVYFIFHDLTVRTEGTFRIKFMFMDLAAGEPTTMSTRVQYEAITEPFTIYSAKKFPGLIASTPLSKAFSKQGMKIAIRGSKPKHLAEGSAAAAEDDEEASSISLPFPKT
ncbi:hypothetical protein DM01DRAFT_1298937 [Hesseltinella vesiculosa]|uniref:Velvet domain-containing protein n=1 Tax=Hesseltinella vesiculosa TaxID=101127 RepID=A0A1X2GW73_9FUNG|nr:hypothetical protein DM01DRAFT_1298937 [Hesseltinella vesiculosa]